MLIFLIDKLKTGLAYNKKLENKIITWGMCVA